MVEEEICEICVMLYVTKLIELERIMIDWEKLNAEELLLAIGELPTDENIKYIDIAREFF
jgi:hypothetical protein